MTPIHPTAVKPEGTIASFLAQVRSLAIILRAEFGVAFAFYDATTGEAVGGLDSGDDVDASCRYQPAKARSLAATQCVQVVWATGKSGYQLLLPLGESATPSLLAVGFVTAFARSDKDVVQEEARLRKWAQAVCDRMSLTVSLPVRHRKHVQKEESSALAWEALVTIEQLAPRVRVHKDSVKHQKRILQAVTELHRVEAVVWVPEQADAGVLGGEKVPFSTFDLRHLAQRLSKSPDLGKAGFLLVNDVKDTSWGTCFPQINNLVACAVRDQGVYGLLIALNKRQTAAAPVGRHSPRGDALAGAALTEARAPISFAPFGHGDVLALAASAALFGMHAGASRRYHDVKELLVGMTRSLTSAIDAKDAYTFGHSERVGRIAVELGRALNLSEDEVNDLYLVGLMHDIGKIGVRDAVLCKNGPLTAEEKEHLKQHVIIGHAIVADLHPIRRLLPGILHHHERYDGAGYPEGLSGESIPFLARILAVADAYDAMTTTRPYRKAMTHDRAGEILREGAGTQWDKQIVDAYFRCCEKVFIIRQRGVGESLRQAINGALRSEVSSRQVGSISPFQATV